MNIQEIAHVTAKLPEEFNRRLHQAVDTMQTKGYTVEIQYADHDGYFSALVIGRGV